ncbi:uncharacterized protein LOC141900371 [Tubulanus polymorphus]|uniref:uncharacterized protein LOC141900371 n=1 Tax=Tubulanus polymorphus TaxID=672921 RepID=UPI003DA5CA70
MSSISLKTNGDFFDDAVYKAIRSGTLELLLKDGLSADFVFTSVDLLVSEPVIGKSLLQIATTEGNVDLMKLLIKYNCNINAGVKKITTADDQVIYQSHRKLDDFTGTCLYYAICSANNEVVRLLINAGADVNMKGAYQICALTHAVDSECIDIIQAILRVKDCNVDAQDIYGLSPLHIAAINGRADIALLLLKKRAIVNIKQCQGGTPLFMLTDYGTLKVLLEYGADPNHATKEDANCGRLTALSSVLRRCRDSLVIESLVYAGAQVTVDCVEDSGDMPRILKNYPDLLAWLKKQYRIPRSLKIQCALCIRKCLSKASNGVGLGINKRVLLLPIPNIIKDFILLKFV